MCEQELTYMSQTLQETVRNKFLSMTEKYAECKQWRNRSHKISVGKDRLRHKLGIFLHEGEGEDDDDHISVHGQLHRKHAGR